jgi:hypothetical protein
MFRLWLSVNETSVICWTLPSHAEKKPRYAQARKLPLRCTSDGSNVVISNFVYFVSMPTKTQQKYIALLSDMANLTPVEKVSKWVGL